jgi:type IV pilus assembly protein PilM
MAMSFLTSGTKKRDQILAIDLGGRTTKAVVLQRKQDSYSLISYALLDAPVYEKGLSADLVGEHLKSVVQALNGGVRHASIAIGVADSIFRRTEMPPIPVSDMRQVLKSSAKNYLQQDLAGFIFDCHILAATTSAKPNGAPAPAAPSLSSQKLQVLVGGAKKQLVDDLQAAAKGAGLVPDQIVPSLVGPPNAFEVSAPDVFNKEVVALVDIGFKNTSICILQEGALVLSRVVAIGGDRITAGLSETMNISYAEAEGIKVGMPQEVQSQLEVLLSPLGRELRASIDFFEHQQDKVVTQIFISGGAGRSEFIVQSLQTELLAPCKVWNPVGGLQLALPPQQLAEVEHVAPQLTVAIGAAISTLS